MTHVLTLRDRTIRWEPGDRPLLMGIVNANPDSFSDRVRLEGLEAQVARARELVDQGADLIDVGGESGVTYTGLTPEQEEIRRVVPLVEALVADGITVSVDTFKAAVAGPALAAGAHLLNDVSALRDPELARLAAATGAGLCVMHTRAAPKVKAVPAYPDGVVADVATLLAERVAVARACGVADEQLLLDPGPDFTKTPQQSVELLRTDAWLGDLDRPWLAAVSRKYFVGAITGRAPDEREAGTLAALGAAVRAGAMMARVHDVRAAADFLAVDRVLSGRAEVGGFDAEDERLKWIRPTG